MFVYKTSGVCSTEIHVEVKDNTIENVEFVRGCPGNLFGISALVKGMNIDEAIEKLKGIDGVVVPGGFGNRNFLS